MISKMEKKKGERGGCQLTTFLTYTGGQDNENIQANTKEPKF